MRKPARVLLAALVIPILSVSVMAVAPPAPLSALTDQVAHVVDFTYGLSESRSLVLLGVALLVAARALRRGPGA